MHHPWDNLEPVARMFCERQLRMAGTDPRTLTAAVDKYWHCVAAEIEAGLVDEHGKRLWPQDAECGVQAYREWRLRHPTYRVPK